MKGKPMTEQHYVVTISHLIGAGGAQIGRALSQRLSIPFVDRDVIKAVADNLRVPVEQLEHREERLSSFWQSFLNLGAYADPMTGLGVYTPSDRDLFDAESTYIGQIAEKGSAIFLGRGARYVLRDHPRHLAILVHADMDDRVRRISALTGESSEQARATIEDDDRSRDRYMRAFASKAWLDPRTYDLCLNTSSIAPDAAEFVGNFVEKLWRHGPREAA